MSGFQDVGIPSRHRATPGDCARAPDVHEAAADVKHGAVEEQGVDFGVRSGVPRGDVPSARILASRARGRPPTAVK
jgi:hypothetical protein